MATPKEQVDAIFDAVGNIADIIESVQKTVPINPSDPDQFENWQYLTRSYITVIGDLQALAQSVDKEQYSVRHVNDSLEAWKKQSPAERESSLKIADMMGLGEKARELDAMVKAEESIPDSIPNDFA